MPDLNWTLKTDVTGGGMNDFTDQADLEFTFYAKLDVSPGATVTYFFPSGWTSGLRFFLLDFGPSDGDMFWAFDDQNLLPAEGTVVAAGGASCGALLTGRKSVRFQNRSKNLKIAGIYLGHAKAGVQPSTGKLRAESDDAYVVPVVRVEVNPKPDFVTYPDIAYYLRSAGSVQTTLPNNGCLTAPISSVSGSVAFGAFVLSSSQYGDGLEYSIDAGKTWKPFSQASVALGIDACAYLPDDLSAVLFRNNSGADVVLSFVCARWVPPLVRS